MISQMIRLYFNYKYSERSLALGHGIIFKGIPIIEISNGGRIEIADSVTINSSNRGYHLNMHSPVKLFADRKGALIKIGKASRIHGTCIHAYEFISIGERCLIAANCQIFDGNGHEISGECVSKRIYTNGSSKPVFIDNDVWIGANTIILPGVTIGYGAVIGAGSIVTKNIPPMVLAAGNPVKILKEIDKNG